MMKGTLPFRAAPQQALTTAASITVGTLSASVTVAAACQQWPSALPFAVATAAACELCKLALFLSGIKALRTAKAWREYAAANIRIALGCLFAMLSVGATIMFMSQAENTEQSRALNNSRAYASAVSLLHGLDAEISTLRAAADNDIAAGYRKRGLATLDRLQLLSTERANAEAKVAALEQQPAAVHAAALPHALALAGVNAAPATANLLLECTIGTALELAGLIFLCGAGTSKTAPPSEASPQPEPPVNPPPEQRNRRSNETRAPDLVATAVTTPQPPAPAAIPATYAKWLRFSFGPRLEERLQQLQSERCHGACRDLLHRMGEHCLRDGWTNGTIDCATIRMHLRAGRDWRTIKGYLARLTLAGALTCEGEVYSIAHFLEANPSVQRRTDRLQEMRSKVRNRQRKLRNTLQTSQPSPLQEAGLKASSPSRHAQKPQPTTHAHPAAHAATHKPTDATPPQLCDSGKQPGVSNPPRRRSYGAVQRCAKSESDDQAFLQKLAAIEAQAVPNTAISAEEAAAAANDFERTLEEIEGPAAPRTNRARTSAQPGDFCIAASIPPNTPPVNLHDVSEACSKIGLPPFGHQADSLFRLGERLGKASGIGLRSVVREARNRRGQPAQKCHRPLTRHHSAAAPAGGR